MQNKNNKKWVVIVGGIAVGFLAVWLVIKLGTPVMQSACRYVLASDAPARKKGFDRKIKIEAAVVEMGKISKRIKTIGKLRANHYVFIKSEIHGRIREIPFEQGSEVEKGQILIQFENDALAAEVNQAKAEYELNRAAYDRLLTLFEKRIESAKTMEEARAKRDAAEARMEAADARLRQAAIKAPFSGKIGIIDVSPGQYVQSGTELVQIVDASKILVDFTVPEKMAGSIGSGQISEIILDGHDKPLRAIVLAVDSHIDSASHTISVRAEIVSDHDDLVPGTFADVSLIIGEKNNAILIPDSAVSRRGDVEYVWKIVKGAAKASGVITGTRENGKVEVTTGLRSGDIVVTDGQIRLAEGYKVDIINMPGYLDDDEVKTRQNLKESAHPVSETSSKKEPVSTDVKNAVDAVKKDADKPEEVASELLPEANVDADESAVKENIITEDKGPDTAEDKPAAEVVVEVVDVENKDKPVASAVESVALNDVPSSVVEVEKAAAEISEVAA